MKKLFWVVVLLVPFNLSCHKGKPEVEMQLPTPVLIPTATAALSPTPSAVEQPTPTATPSLQYSIEDIKGTALIIPADSALPESAEEGEMVEAGDQVLTKDNSEMTLALNDTTMIHVSANSQIKIVDLTPNTTQGFSSRIELILGNILSEVEKLSESKSSFEVEAGGVVCGVRGTAFEVQNQEGNVSTSTFHGVVEMKKDGQTQNVNANEHSTFSFKKANFLAQRRLSPTEKKHYQSWAKTKAVVQKRRAIRASHQATGQFHPVKKSQHQAAMRTTRTEKPKAIKKSARSAQPRSKAKNNRREIKKPLKKQVQMKPKAKPAQTHAQIKPKPMTNPRNLQPKKKTPARPQARPAVRRPEKKKKRN